MKNKTTRTGLCIIAIAIAGIAGFSIGFTYCQAMWEKAVVSQLKQR